jgi:hypothetical protein
MSETYIFEKPEHFTEAQWEALCDALDYYASTWTDDEEDE